MEVLEPGVEEGANTCLCGAVESSGNVCPGAALKGRYVRGEGTGACREAGHFSGRKCKCMPK